MFRNYLKTALRNLFKNKIFTIINILGLAIGIAASLLIFQYVENELIYDNFHEKSENIYRLRGDRFSQGELAEEMATVCDALGPLLPDAFPEVKDYVVLSNYQLEGVISYGEHNHKLQKAFFATSSFFNVFSYKLLQGDPDKVLTEPFSIVISESLATKLFPDGDAVGRMVKFNNRRTLAISGVFEDVPENSHLKFNILFSFQTMVEWYGKWTEDSWWVDIALTYLLLEPNTDTDELITKIDKFVDDRIGKELREQNQAMKFYLLPVEDIHLYSNFPGEAEVNGDHKTVHFLLIISFLIIIIAWVNYINMATARSLERSKEVGLRKVSGASRTQLIRQFLLESLVLNLIAVLVAILIVIVIHPVFYDFTGLNISLELFGNLEFCLAFALIILTGTILSGLYPAFIMSSFKPIVVLKGKMSSGGKGNILRKALIIFQFVISIILISGTLTVFKQVKYMQNQYLGVNLEQTLIVEGPVSFDSTWIHQQKSFNNELLLNAAISDVCASYFVPGDEVWFTNGYIKQSNNDEKASRTLQVIHVDHNFLDYYDFDFLAGRNFTEGSETDLLGHIINRETCELLGFENPEDALNEELNCPNWRSTKKIIGVIENYHQRSLKEKFGPIIYTYLPHPRFLKKYSIKVHPQNLKETIAYIEKQFADFFPGNTFDYYFLDKHYDEQYKSDTQFGRTFAIFSVLAIFIACLGLFALSLYFALQRTKEIAVRKVLGAGLKEIFSLLSKDYLMLFFIAILIAFPISYLIMDNWLGNYAYRINFGYWFFLVPVLAMIFIIFISVFYQVNKAARANPASSLKYE
ncbi:MAG: ABC transporter permease [Bacteroidales bacterium]|nr:ABC transporter permease [Bacteroidales bacterium]